MDYEYSQSENLTYAKNKDPMYDDDILCNNHFNGLSYKELLNLWDALKDFYKRGYILKDSPLEPYRKEFCGKNINGLSDMQRELLTILSVKFINLALTEDCPHMIISFGEQEIKKVRSLLCITHLSELILQQSQVVLKWLAKIKDVLKLG